MRFFGPRVGLSSVLIGGAIVLVVAIVIGNSMGNGVLGQIGAKLPPINPTPAAPTTAPTPLGKAEANWKRTQVMAVATDPGFPDPRITPEPPPPETPRPRPKRTQPPPTPLDTFDGDSSPTITPSSVPSFSYTSPPLPIPIATRPGETPSPDVETSGSPRPSGRGTPSRYAAPTLPPVPVQTLNP